MYFIIKFQKNPFGCASFQDPFYRKVIINDFNGFCSAHETNGCYLEELKVIWECLKEQPERRPTIQSLLFHPLAKFSQQQVTLDLMQEILKIRSSSVQ